MRAAEIPSIFLEKSGRGRVFPIFLGKRKESQGVDSSNLDTVCGVWVVLGVES